MLEQEKKLREIVVELAGKTYPADTDFVTALRRVFSARKLAPDSKSTLISIYGQLIKEGKLIADKKFERLLTKRSVRTLSGVSVITVLTKPFVCPGKCVYCPTEPDMPKSYLSNEPAAQRAKRNLFDPEKQMRMRILALENNGHQVDKLEVLVLGGTWSVYPDKYQREFVRDLFYAANTYGESHPRERLTLREEQDINETARYRIIGLTLETRPDFVSDFEIKRLRELGCTRVQLGVQHTDNKILDYIQRGEHIEDSIHATKKLKEAGFKVDHHYMPDLPGSTPTKDLACFQYVFTSPDLQPDQLKIYPCVVNEFAELHQWFISGQYKPYTVKQLSDLLLKIKLMVPPYMRINRLIRDIPEESIIAGNKITNLRQFLQAELARQGKSCQCIRCREVKGDTVNPDEVELVTRTYPASDGEEYFLSFESKDRRKIYAFLRLRFNEDPKKNILPELLEASLVRELHVYGKMIPVRGENNDEEISADQTQHLGFGRQLMAEAEKITKAKGLNKIAVISGIGVREYYKKLGYQLEGTYMTKNL